MTGHNETDINFNEPEIYRCVIISNAHMRENDAVLLEKLSRNMEGEFGAFYWIDTTPGGFILRVAASGDAPVLLREAGLSEDCCQIVTVLSEKLRADIIHFDQDGEELTGFPVHNW